MGQLWVKVSLPYGVEGETLAGRIAQGPIPLDEALTIARQIAEALEAAHEHGIVHRDLKPANVKLRGDGIVKVLDFGLAKAVSGTSAIEHDLAHSPTLTSPAMMTGVGMILGTAAYMSPNQAKGRIVDKRSDVWAFGCVLYEMVTGRRAFPAEDVSDTLALVLKGEPDWTLVPSDLPRAIRDLIQGCLRKNQQERIASISIALFVLNQPQVVAGTTSIGRPLPPYWRRAVPVMASALLSAAIAATVVWQFRPVPAVPVTRLTFTLPEQQQFNVNRRVVDLSPDGTRLVYSANARLYLRSMSEFDAAEIPGTDPGINPMFSPDGQSVAFWSDGTLKSVAVGGGTATVIRQIGPLPWGGIAWDRSGILFSQAGMEIVRVSPADGKSEVLVDLKSTDDLAFGPQMLPDGDSLLFTLLKRTDAAIDRLDQGGTISRVSIPMASGSRLKRPMARRPSSRFTTCPERVRSGG